MSEPTDNSWETFKAWAESFGFIPVDPDDDHEGETEVWVIARQAGDEEEPPRSG